MFGFYGFTCFSNDGYYVTMEGVVLSMARVCISYIKSFIEHMNSSCNTYILGWG